MIKNIIFDLGGVILEIDKNKTISAFENLGINFHQIIDIEFLGRSKYKIFWSLFFVSIL